MPKKSLGATVNLIILASKIEGTSIIKNASTEPEIDDLINYINKGYAKVYRKNSDVIIKGSNETIDMVKHKVIPDRIECFTYMCIGSISKKLVIRNINTEHLKMPIFYLRNAGLYIKIRKNSLVIKQRKLKKISVNSGDYPSLSTDQMPMLYPLFTRVEGESIFLEGIFENRFGVCDELRKTNANILIDNKRVIITGKKDISKTELYANDLRGAASLLIECIISQGGAINNLKYLERGYCDIYNKLKKIGLSFKIE
jgi:UDP-N-acetylglucosamine 1-carboxyvinyltransferase